MLNSLRFYSHLPFDYHCRFCGVRFHSKQFISLSYYALTAFFEVGFSIMSSHKSAINSNRRFSFYIHCVFTWRSIPKCCFLFCVSHNMYVGTVKKANGLLNFLGFPPYEHERYLSLTQDKWGIAKVVTFLWTVYTTSVVYYNTYKWNSRFV